MGVRVDVNGCEVFVKIQKKNCLEEGGGQVGGWVFGEGQGGCE